jgi:predicted nucleotidyltransferase
VNEPLQTTLADVVSFLQVKNIPYALIGGLAVSLRGETRVTADVDIVIAADVERGLSLIGELEGSNFRPLFTDVAEVVAKAFLLPLRHRDTNVKVDIAIGLSGFERQIVERAELLDLAGTRVAVATAEDLLIMKVLAGRPRDEQDLRGLVIAQGSRLDWDYCLRLATELGSALELDLASRVLVLRSSVNADS